jgi:RNA polymerase sigma factor (TIGR02999 family)
MAREASGHTLQPTALVNEAYLRLIEGKRVQVRDRAHFFALSAKLIRRILVDFARTRRAQKRGADARHIPLEEATVVSPRGSSAIIAMDEALEKLAALDPRKSQIVELRFFGGLSFEEIAELLKIGASTVYRDFDTAKVWLMREIERGKPS